MTDVCMACMEGKISQIPKKRGKTKDLLLKLKKLGIEAATPTHYYDCSEAPYNQQCVLFSTSFAYVKQ
jgi:hypothetical protein